MSEENFGMYDGAGFKTGTLEDISDEEPAGPDELERQAIKAELEPVLRLPSKGKRYYRGAWDSSDEIGFDAFGTVDFDKYRPEFDKVMYKADKLREQRRDLVIMIKIVSNRIPGMAKYQALKLVRQGIIEPDDLEGDLWLLARIYMRALGIRRQISDLQEQSRKRKIHKVKKWLDSLG